MEPIIAIVLALIGYALGSTKIINEGNAAIVERLGRRHRTLSPGLNFIVPLVDQIVMEDTTREQFIDIKPQNVITKDNIYLEVDAILYWRIREIEKSFYAIEDLQGALTQLATTTLREVIAQNTVEETNVTREEMNRSILGQLNETTANWGVEIIRLDIQRITPPESVRKTMEEERAAEFKKRALISEAEGERQAAIKKAEGTMTSIQIIAEALSSNPESKEILRYLVAQDHINASYRLGESQNAKVVFVDPGKSGELMKEVIAESANTEGNGKMSGE
ncbi:SPFH domain-containing protein [Nostoc sp. TCL26-01]|uniref:SPFH domain-containing protein n=1 Tax=Nostoc sp. TCL26-01 TaxID=2576904 RepID=UPI0015C1303D|nr:SPFH domain-containing protein [Nostoc sp. TCL26-01]QLE54725.1 SPFH/Band 7/PHB domain protein [Nostoc sp. TCL26-01]